MSSFERPGRASGRVRRRAVYAAGAFALVAVFFAPLVPALTVSPRERGFPLASPLVVGPTLVVGPVLSREGFELSYTHSVNKGRVTDYLEIESSGDLVVRSSRFVSYGAGMSEPDEGGRFADRGDSLELTGIDRAVPRVLLAVGEIAGHEIARAGLRYALADRFAPRTSVIIEYRPVSAFVLLRSGLRRR